MYIVYFSVVLCEKNSMPLCDKISQLKFRYNLILTSMFKNYFKIAWRNLLRNKGYAAINITGLAVGIAVCLVIFIIIQYHTGFDSFHSKKDRAYRVLTEYQNTADGNIRYAKNVPYPLPLALKSKYPVTEAV